MSQPTIEQLTAELSTLRTTNAELVQKSRSRAARITDLVAKQDELTSKLTASETALHEATVGRPLREMAETVSPVPELWQGEFLKHFKVELTDGRLVVLTQAGEPAKVKDEPVEFTREGLTTLLAQSDAPELKAFKTIMVSSLASGGGARTQGNGRHTATGTSQSETNSVPKPSFGLR